MAFTFLNTSMMLVSPFIFVAFAQQQRTPPDRTEAPVLVQQAGETFFATSDVYSLANPNSAGMVAVRVDTYSSSRNRSQGRRSVPLSSISQPASSYTVRLQGADRSLRAGTLTLRNNQMYQIQHVFPDGHVMAVPVAAQHGSLRAVQNGDVVTYQQARVTPVVFHSREISAVSIRQYNAGREGHYQVGEQYRLVSGLPLCDQAALRQQTLPAGLRDQETLAFSCGRNGQGPTLDAIFSDGSLVMGGRIFNPFPDSIDQYTTPEDREGTGASF